MKEQIYKVVDVETGNYCIYEGEYLSDAFEEIRDNGKIKDQYGYTYSEDFTDSELWELYCDDERIWCGKTDTIAELVDLRYPDPAFGKKVKDYMYAVYAWGSDPVYIEDVDVAINVFIRVNESRYQDRIEEEGAFYCTCLWEKLSLYDEKPTIIYSASDYNSEALIICFEPDYSGRTWPRPYTFDWDEEEVYLLHPKEGLPKPRQLENNIGVYPVTMRLLSLITPDEIISLEKDKHGEVCYNEEDGWYIATED